MMEIILCACAVTISICMLITWFKVRREKRKLNRDNWYVAILKTLEKGCWIKDPEEEFKRWKVTGVDESAGEVYLTLYIFHPINNSCVAVSTAMWTLEYVMLGLYNNEIIIVEK